MSKAMGTLIVVAGLMVVAGCAREDRWTMSGARPVPLDDLKQTQRAAAPAARPSAPAARPSAVAAVPGAPSATGKMKGVELAAKNSFATLTNSSSEAMVARVQVIPGANNTPRESPHELQVAMPAKSEVRAGFMGDDRSENVWSYRLLDAWNQ